MNIVYKERWLVDFVNTQVARTRVTNQSLLESRIHKQLEKYLLKFQDAHRHRNKLRQIVNDEIASSVKLYKLERTESFSGTCVVNDFGESLEFEPEDVLANVEEPMLEKSSISERIRSLAATDSEEFVLNAWIDEKSDSEIARELALRFGGNSRSLRIWVQRFRTKCQERLEEECLENNLLIKTA